ncbi:hypothetical protein [Kribbella sp. NPDC048928]
MSTAPHELEPATGRTEFAAQICDGDAGPLTATAESTHQLTA